jgi:ankyrin repeat protein
VLILSRFLLAQLHLDSLMDKTTESDIRTALESLPTGSDAYDQAYENAMKRIREQDADGEKLAKQALMWITCARRPLTTAELQHGIAVRPGKSDFDEKSQPDIEDIVSVCAGLVTVDEESNIIRLVHYTTQEYFERTQKRWFPDAETDIAKTCVTYLSFDAFNTGFCLTDKEFEVRLQENVLYDYAARNWGHHARTASTEVENLILSFLESGAKLSACTQAMMASKHYSSRLYNSQQAPGHLTGLHLAAFFGLEEVINALLKKSHSPDLKDSYGRTPLSWASRNGQEVIVELLLGIKGIKPDSKDNWGQTPLSWAARNGHETVVKLLLTVHSIDPDSKASDRRTPLSWAAANGSEAIVMMLLGTKGVEPDSKDIWDQTPLSWAARNGHEAVAKLLLAKNGVNIVSKSKYGRTPLSLAAVKGCEAVLKLLLATDGVEPDSKDNNGQTPLSWAARKGHQSAVKLLLTTGGVDPDSKDNRGQTPLTWAARNGYGEVVKLLLATDGVELDPKDEDGHTPLWWAASRGHEAVVKLLQSRLQPTFPQSTV